MSKIEDCTPSRSGKICTVICLERPRKYPAGHPVRMTVQCRGCSQLCTIDLRLPDGFPSAYVEQIGGVFSTLCEKLAEVPAPDGGQQSLLSVASEV